MSEMRRSPALVVAIALVSLVLIVPASASAETGSAGHALPRGGSGRGAIDPASVIETVSHHVARVDGVLRAEDDLYAASFDTAGFSVALRQRVSASRLAALADHLVPTGVALRNLRRSSRGTAFPSTVPASAIPFERTAAFRLDVVGIRAEGFATAPALGSWHSDYNAAERQIAPGITERVTALDDVLEWDLVVERPIRGSLGIDARITGGAAGRRIDAATEGVRRYLPARAWRFALGDGRAVRVGEMIVKDASGRVLYRALPSLHGTTLSLDVPEEALAFASYPVTIDPVVGPEYPASDPVYVANASTQFAPAVAASPSGFLVAWSDDRETYREGINIYAARVDPSGGLLDPAGIEIATQAIHEYYPSVAFNGTDYLVAWDEYSINFTDSDVAALRVGTDGIPIGDRIVVKDGAGVQYGATAEDYGTDGFVVGWTEPANNGDIALQRFSSTGAPVGGQIDVATTADFQDQPRISTIGNTILVVWRDGRGFSGATQYDVYGQVVDGATGSLTGANVQISSGSGYEQNPAVANDGTNFFVVWEDGRNVSAIPQFDIFGQRVDASIALLGSEISISGARSNQQLAPDVEWTGAQYLVVFQDLGGSSWEVLGRRFNASGGSLSSLFSVAGGVGSQVDPQLAWNGTQFALAYQDDRRGDPNITARLLNANGSTLLSGDVSMAAPTQLQPDASWNGESYLVVWYESRSGDLDIYGARVLPDGTILDESGIPIAVGPSLSGTPRVAWGGDAFLVVWDDLLATWDWDVHAARVDAAGNVLDRSPIVVSDTPRRDGVPDVAWNGSTFLVAWEDWTGAQYDVRGARVTGSGSVLDGGDGLPISTFSASQQAPRVASNGTDFLVVWHDSRGGGATGWDVYGTRVQGDGDVLDPSGIPISTAVVDQVYPRLDTDGTDYFVAWEDWRDYATASNDIYGQFVTAGGGLDGSNVPISVGTHGEGVPGVAYDGVNFVVVWHDTRDQATNEWDIYGNRVTRDGVLLDGTNGFAVAATVDARDGWPNATSGPDGTVLVTWERFSKEPIYGSVNRAFFATIGVDGPSTPSLTQPSVAFQKQTAFPVAWTASTPGENPLATYRVSQREAPFDAPFGAPTVTSVADPATSLAISGVTGRTYCFTVTAEDSQGYRSAPSDEVCTTVPLDDAELAHKGAWAQKTGSGYYLNTYSDTSAKGASLRKAGVRAKQIALLVTKCSGCGQLKVYLGTTLVGKVSLASATTKKKQLVVLPALSSVTTGTLKIVNANGKRTIVEGVGVSPV